MTYEREIQIEGTYYNVVISDDPATLLAAKAAGRVAVALLSQQEGQDLSSAEYAVERLEAADNKYLEQVVRRHLDLPWTIGVSERILLREFTLDDIPSVLREETDTEADALFYTPDQLSAYIRYQYRFYEYGIWAVVRKSDGVLLGKAGITACEDKLELGYHIFSPYRRQGYAVEACRMILDYVRRELDSPVYAVTDPANEGSKKVLEQLGFWLTEQKYNEAALQTGLYVWNY